MTAAPKWNGNTMGGEKPRLADDAYFTPEPLARAICRRLRETIGEPDLIVEPSAGHGSFVRAAGAVFPRAMEQIAVEPTADESDAIRATPPGEQWPPVVWLPLPWESPKIDGMPEWRSRAHSSALIVGNPPFSLAEQHVAIALDRLAQGEGTDRYLCFLLRASFLAGAGRHRALHSHGCLRYVWHVIGRPAFTPDGKTDAAEYAVCVWQSGYSGPYEGGWLTWKA